MTAERPHKSWGRSTQAFHVMAKPSGPECNLGCQYCFYLEKEALFPVGESRRMSPDTLEAYIRNYIDSHPTGQPVTFAWQGGEPTLLGLDFYKRAVALQQHYAHGGLIQNAFQTNGTLLNDDWCDFFAENGFLIGLSLDGPAHIHDRYRVNRSGAPTHSKVMRALRTLQRHDVDFNILACVNNLSSRSPLEIYRFFRDEGTKVIQFIPIIERTSAGDYRRQGFTLEGPMNNKGISDTQPTVTDWSVEPARWGSFLTTIFDEWIATDVGDMFIMNFEWSLAAFMNRRGVICVHQENCGRAVVAEHNGDVYSCDHFTYPDYRLGNLMEASFTEILDSDKQKIFGSNKSRALPNKCHQCQYRRGCWGGCPKHRFIKTEDGEYGLNYLCSGYFNYFQHITPYLSTLRELITAHRPARDIMDMTLPIDGGSQR